MGLQHIAALILTVRLEQDTPKGTLVGANGKLMSDVADGNVPMQLGITQQDAKEDELVAVTVLGTASLLVPSGQTPKQGDALLHSADGTISFETLTTANYDSKRNQVIGVALEDGVAGGFVEVLLR